MFNYAHTELQCFWLCFPCPEMKSKLASRSKQTNPILEITQSTKTIIITIYISVFLIWKFLWKCLFWSPLKKKCVNAMTFEHLMWNLIACINPLCLCVPTQHQLPVTHFCHFHATFSYFFSIFKSNAALKLSTVTLTYFVNRNHALDSFVELWIILCLHKDKWCSKHPLLAQAHIN